jgi:hypothetical protein
MMTTDFVCNYDSLSVFARPLHSVSGQCLALDLPRLLWDAFQFSHLRSVRYCHWNDIYVIPSFKVTLLLLHFCITARVMGRDNSVGTATCYGLDGPRIESRWGRNFPHPSRPALGPTQSLVRWVRVKRPGRGVDHPPPSSVEVKEIVELNLYSPSGLSWSVLGWTLPLPLPLPLPFMERFIQRTYARMLALRTFSYALEK